MPITTRQPAPPTFMQKFRTITEGYLTQVAQREMLRQYPGSGTPPASKPGLIYALLPYLFLPGYKLTPWAIKKRLLTAFFVHPEQQWPARPWEAPPKSE
jgi:hypothetical protein